MFNNDIEIKTDSDYSSIYQTLTVRNLPTAILSTMMKVFEKHRISKKIGWLRPWNKDNLIIFKNFRWYPTEDKDLFDLVSKFLLQNISLFDENYEDFIRDLLNDRRTQGFLFYHDNLFVLEKLNFEGITISLGRMYSKGSRYRDRIDIIMESNIFDSISSQKSDRIRVYIDPYLSTNKFPLPLYINHSEIKNIQQFYNLHGLIIEKYHLWRNSEREWFHWSQKYIRYFGERKNIPINTLFFTKNLLNQSPLHEIHEETP
jgi:hypothetical protein